MPAAAKVGLIDYGAGNLHSVAKALEHGGARVELLADGAAIARSGRLVLPGVGAFGASMGQLRARGMVEPILRALETRPFLGVCVGLQLLLEGSDEDPGESGLGHVPGRCQRLQAGSRCKVPHMGWAATAATGSAHPLFAGLDAANWFYYAHSYYLDAASDHVLAATTAGNGTGNGARIAAALAKGNVAATQFHPEKSAAAGLRVCSNFLAWDGV